MGQEWIPLVTVVGNVGLGAVIALALVFRIVPDIRTMLTAAQAAQAQNHQQMLEAINKNTDATRDAATSLARLDGTIHMLRSVNGSH